MRGTRRIRGAGWLGIVVIAALAVPTAAAAQKTCDEEAGTLGIQGMRCEGCTFRMSRGGLEEARFRTEPEIVAVARGFTRGDRLRAGDRIIALDDVLVTTREGGEKLAGLTAGEPVLVRIRRDGVVRQLRMVAGSACELRRRAEEGEVEVERITSVGPGTDLFAVPPAPAAPASKPGAPSEPRAAAPELPPLPAVPGPPAPTGYLGFGFRCSECGYRDGAMFFASPPVVQGVLVGGPAAEAGLRSGDEILAVNGASITGRGAQTFGEIEPGDTVQMTVRQGDTRRMVVLVAGERRMPAPPPPAPGPISDRLRFEGRIDGVRIEVRGGPIRVDRRDEPGEIVIRTDTHVIRLTAEGG